jgi:DNA-binding NarL/FixJ family response regulator
MLPIRLLIADDHAIFRDGLRTSVAYTDTITLLAEAKDGEQLVQLVQQYEPDVVLADIKMPTMDGIAATKVIATSYPAVAVVALSMFNEESLIADMLAAGARGYILKSAGRDEIITAIQTVAKGQQYYCNSTTKQLVQLIAKQGFDPASGVMAAPILNPREMEVVRLICADYTSKEIGAMLHQSPRTIEGHRQRIMEKLGVQGTAGIVLYAIKTRLVEVGL